MPTFDDPRKDSAEAYQALRGLAHASRTFTDPADTYPVIGDLLGDVRILRQVFDQVAAAHIAHRARAHDDFGDQAAGATSALATADNLHQAGTLMDAVEELLDAASQHSGRIAWHPAETPELDTSGPGRSTARAGTLTLTVWPDTPLDEHQRYAYRVEDTPTGKSVEGRDLFTGAGAPVEPDRALRELAGFLSAAGEARQYALDNPGTHPENEGLFPTWAADAARQNADALSELAEDGPRPPDAEPAVERRWIGVVFLRGEGAGKVLDLIDREGTDAAIDRLARFDHGDETMQTALEDGSVYARPPAGTLDRTTTRGDYTLVHNPFSGYISLYREFTTAPDLAPEPTGVHPLVNAMIERHAKRQAATPAEPPARTVPGKAVGADWFAPRTGTSSASHRGLAL